MSAKSDIWKIADDIWISTFYYLSVSDFLSIGKTCVYFHDLANNNTVNYSFSNKYWENQCKHLWSLIDKNNFKANNWKTFYRELVESTKTKPKEVTTLFKLNINSCESNEINKYFEYISMNDINNIQNSIYTMCKYDLLPFFKVLICNMSDKQLNAIPVVNFAINSNAVKIGKYLLGHKVTPTNSNQESNSNYNHKICNKRKNKRKQCSYNYEFPNIKFKRCTA